LRARQRGRLFTTRQIITVASGALREVDLFASRCLFGRIDGRRGRRLRSLLGGERGASQGEDYTDGVAAEVYD